MTLVFLNLSPLLGAWLVGAGYPCQHLETLGRREEELFSVDSGSICGCELAQAAGNFGYSKLGAETSVLSYIGENREKRQEEEMERREGSLLSRGPPPQQSLSILFLSISSSLSLVGI